MRRAEAHDEYVREHALERPLHFPREGELSSDSDAVQPKGQRWIERQATSTQEESEARSEVDPRAVK